LNQPVGTLVDPVSATVLRKVGDDWVLLSTARKGFVQIRINFYHKLPNCQGERYMTVNNGAGLVYVAQISGTTAHYSRLVDRTVLTAFQSLEVLDPGQTVGNCFASAGSLPLGVALTADLSSLAPEFRVQ
jgi:hypothetical protein